MNSYYHGSKGIDTLCNRLFDTLCNRWIVAESVSQSVSLVYITPNTYNTYDTICIRYCYADTSRTGILRVCTKYFQHTTNAGMQSRCGNHLRCYTKLADLTTIFFALVVGALVKSKPIQPYSPWGIWVEDGAG